MGVLQEARGSADETVDETWLADEVVTGRFNQ